MPHLDLIESFVDENPAHLSDDELDIVRSWRHLVDGKFYVFRELKKYTVFLSTTSPAIAYGVLALSQPFEELIGPYLPVLTQTVLLPFKGVIVYDGLMSSYNISFGPGIRRNLEREISRRPRHGTGSSRRCRCRTSRCLPKAPKARPVPKPPSREEKDEALQVVIGLIDQFCKEHLNEEYAVLCRKLAEKLGRKRPSPLLQGSPNAWASGIGGLHMEVPPRWRGYPCEDYFSSPFAIDGLWDEHSQLWLVEPAKREEESEEGFLQVRRPGVDSIGFGPLNQSGVSRLSTAWTASSNSLRSRFRNFPV